MSFEARLPIVLTLRSGVQLKTEIVGYHDESGERAGWEVDRILQNISGAMGPAHPDEEPMNPPGLYFLPSEIAAISYGLLRITGEAPYDQKRRLFYTIWNDGSDTLWTGFYRKYSEAQKEWDNEEANRGDTLEGEISHIDVDFDLDSVSEVYFLLDVSGGIDVEIYNNEVSWRADLGEREVLRLGGRIQGSEKMMFGVWNGKQSIEYRFR